MISMITGEVAHVKGSELTVMVGGVGYLVHVPPGAHEARCGQDVRLYTTMMVRDDAINLYGFFDPGQREIFTLLLNVTGVGPKIAMGIISRVDPNRFLDAVITENIPYLCSLPGIGKKSAQRIVFELKERVSREYAGRIEKRGGVVDDAVAALIALGYSESQARRVMEGIEADTVEETVRLALKALMR